MFVVFDLLELRNLDMGMSPERSVEDSRQQLQVMIMNADIIDTRQPEKECFA